MLLSALGGAAAVIVIAAASLALLVSRFPGPTGHPGKTPTVPPSQPTPTLAPVQCDAQFSSGYQATLPGSTYAETTVYAQIQLPPETRTWSDDASGHRFRYMCSAGTSESVLAFVQAHLTAQGWQPEDHIAGRYCER